MPKEATIAIEEQALSGVEPHSFLSSAKILIADDEQMIRDVCQAVLRRSGFTPIVAGNGLEALRIYERMQSEIVLTLCDVAMPVMDGVEFVRNVFEMDPKSNVILMTGFNPREAAPEDLRRLCSVIAKPFNPAQLMTAVMKCLEYQQQHHPREQMTDLALTGSGAIS